MPAYAGVTRDVFAGDGTALEAYEAAFALGKYTPEVFANHVNLFEDPPYRGHRRGGSHRTDRTGLVHGWATISLSGHSPQTQVARWGLPLLTHLFIGKRNAGRLQPHHSLGRQRPFTAQIADVVQETTRRAGTTADPASYAQRFLARLGTLTLPYQSAPRPHSTTPDSTAARWPTTSRTSCCPCGPTPRSATALLPTRPASMPISLLQPGSLKGGLTR